MFVIAIFDICKHYYRLPDNHSRRVIVPLAVIIAESSVPLAVKQSDLTRSEKLFGIRLADSGSLGIRKEFLAEAT